MKQLLAWIGIAAVSGVVLGVVLGYVEAKPWAFSVPEPGGISELSHAGHNHDEDAKVPELAIDEPVFEFGNMEIGTSRRHSFPITNKGEVPLTVKFLSNTCQCTAVELDGKMAEGSPPLVLAPGESSTVELEWIAKGSPRTFRHGATFETSDPARRRLEIQVTGELVDSTSLNPAVLHFGVVKVGQPGEASLTITSYVESELKILEHEIVDKRFAEQVELDFQELQPFELSNPTAKAGLRVVAKYQPGKSLGPFQGFLKLKTNLSRASQLTVPIAGTVVGDVSMHGPGWKRNKGLLKLPPIKGDKGGEVKLKMVVRGSEVDGSQIAVASTSPSVLKAELSEIEEMPGDLRHVNLTVSIPKGTRPMARLGGDLGKEGEIVVKTGHPVTPEFKLRVAFIVQ
ncbi:MAG: DUF1573 domain-containing protein [Lacipirellulaceae bacterium]